MERKKRKYIKSSDLHLLAKQFVMKRIENLEIQDGRKFYLEPKLIEEWQYYVFCTWQKNTLIRGWDLDYLYDEPRGVPSK